MAFTLNQIFAFLTQDLTDVTNGITNTPVVSLIGSDYELVCEQGDRARFLIFDAVAKAGDNHVVIGYYTRVNTGHTGDSDIINIIDTGGNLILELRVIQSTGDVQVIDSKAAVKDTITNPFTLGQKHRLKIYFQNANSGAFKMEVDGTEVSNVVACDFKTGNNTVDYLELKTSGGGKTQRFSKWLWYSDATDITDGPAGDVDVLMYQKTDGGTQDQGDAFDVGDWGKVSQAPFTTGAGNRGEYTGDPRSGEMITNSGTRSGPSGDSNASGTNVLGCKIIGDFSAGTGGSTTYSIIYGNNVDTLTEDVVTVNATNTILMKVSEAANVVPTLSQFFQMGGKVVGPADLRIENMVAYLVVEPSSGVTVTPGPASAKAAVVDPNTVLSGITIIPNTASARSLVMDPSVQLGGITLTPTLAAARTLSFDPNIILGGITISGEIAAAKALGVDPQVVIGEILVNPSITSAIATALNPTVQLGGITLNGGTAAARALVIDPNVDTSLVLNPDPAAARALGLDPNSILGGITISGEIAAVSTEGVDPGVVLGGILVNPSIASVIAAALNPTVESGGITLTGGTAAAVALGLDPGVVLGGITIISTTAASRALVIDPNVDTSIRISPNPAIAKVFATEAVVILGSITISGNVSGLRALAVDPGTVLGGLVLNPGSAAAIVNALDGNLILGGLTVSPNPANVISIGQDPVIELGGITLSPGPAVSKSLVVDPSVFSGGIFIQPVAAGTRVTSLDPNYFLGPITLTPSAAAASALGIDPNTLLVWILDVDPLRTYAVPEEIRKYTIPYENRVYKVEVNQ